jgi:ribosomal protein S18 acetylase RimI-like enzyme
VTATTPKPLGWPDVPRIYDLALRRAAADDPPKRMRIGHMYWALRATSAGDLLADSWAWPRDDASLAAFAWLDAPDVADAMIAPDASSSVLHDALDWLEAECRVRGWPHVSVVAVDGDRDRIETLLQRSYAIGDGGNARFSMQLTPSPDAIALPDGYTLRHVSTPGDIALRADIESRAYSGNVSADTWRSFQERLPGYRADLDLLVVAPDGTGASAITCWYDPTTRCGEIEAVGTVPEHRRRGLCRALIVGGLRRLCDAGATHAVVQTRIANAPARALYPSCGFTPAGIDRAWVKQL